MATPTFDVAHTTAEPADAAQVATIPVRPAPLVRPHPACTCPHDPDGCAPCHGADWLDWCTQCWCARFTGTAPLYGLTDPGPLNPSCSGAPMDITVPAPATNGGAR